MKNSMLSISSIKTLLLVLLSLIIYSCKDGNIDPNFTLESINPDSAKVGDVIRINGTGFSRVPAEDTVLFKGIPGIVQTAATTTLLVQVPTGATTGTVMIKVGDKAFTSTKPFKVLNQGPNSGVSYITVLGGQASFTKLATLPQTPTFMYIDKPRNLLYYSDFPQIPFGPLNNGSSVYKLPLTGGTAQKLSSDARITNVKNITSDGLGNVYVLAIETTDQIEGSIYKITPDGAQVTQVAAKVKLPNNKTFAANAAGDVYYGDMVYTANGQSTYNPNLQSSAYTSLYKNEAFYYLANSGSGQPVSRYNMLNNNITTTGITLQALFTPDDANYIPYNTLSSKNNYAFSADNNENFYALYQHTASNGETANTYYLRKAHNGSSTLLAKFSTIFSITGFVNDPQRSTGGILFDSDTGGNLYLRYNDKDIIKISHN